MWKHNLNRQITKLWPSIKISGFLLIWNGVFHSLTLSILLYWSLSSQRVPELSRITTLNQFWAENQILFAALCGITGALFFRDQMSRVLQSRWEGGPDFWLSAARGCGLTLLLVLALILKGRYEFLGVSTQLNLNFLSSYAWILRSLLLTVFVVSLEFLTREVLKGPTWIRIATQLGIYWIWFFPSRGEFLSLTLISLLFSQFWSAAGFSTALFVMSHAIFGLGFFENEFSGLLQIRSLRSEETFLQNPYLQVVLLTLWAVFRYVKLWIRKEPAHP